MVVGLITRSAEQRSERRPGEALEASVPSRTQRRQRLRIRRFVFASVFSILFVVVLTAFYALNKVDEGTLVHAGVLVVVFIVVFLFLFRTGRNQRFSDPSLTSWQFVIAVVTMLYVVYRAPETRLAFTAFFFVALMFGMLRRDSKSIAVLGSVSVMLFAMVSAVRYTANRDDEMLALDILQVLVIGVTFPWLVFLAGRIHRIQQGLTAVRLKLEDSKKGSS